MTDEELKPLPASVAKLTKCELLRLAVIKHNESVGLRSENQRLVGVIVSHLEWLESTDRFSDREPAKKLRAAIGKE